MSVASLAAFARMSASHADFIASYQTDKRPAAIVESDAADVDFIASMVGVTLWVRADYEPSGVLLGRVSMAFERGDVRTEHGVNNWGGFCPTSYSLREAKAFFRAQDGQSEWAQALDAAGCAQEQEQEQEQEQVSQPATAQPAPLVTGYGYVPAAGIQTTLLF